MIYTYIDNYLLPLQEETFMTNTIKSFYSYCKYYYKERLGSRTIYLKIRQIEAFERFLYWHYNNEIDSFSKISENHINDYKQFCLEGLKNDRKTLNGKINALSYFFKYTTKEGLTPYNYALNVTKVKVLNKKLPIFKSSDLNILFSEMGKFKCGIRDVVISKIILISGLEIKDVLSFKINNIDLDNSCINYNNKVFPINSMLRNDIIEYLNIRSIININSLEYLFISKIGTVYSVRSYQLLFRKALIDTPIPLSYSPRALKYTFLYNLSRVVDEEELKNITDQKFVKQYYELSRNPLHNLI